MLIVFAAQHSDKNFRIQRETLERNWKGVLERDMVILTVVSDAKPGFGEPLSAAEKETLRETYSVKETDFKVILVGKDGGAKLTVNEPVSIEKLFRLIDSMPMRQAEMRERRG